MDFPEKIKNAVAEFSQLPGIGEKTALRQVLYLSKYFNGYTLAVIEYLLAKAIFYIDI